MSSSPVSPAEGHVSSEYGYRKAIPGVVPAMLHAGIDIANALGTPIYAMYSGTVQAVGANGVAGRSGKYILISNPDGERQYYGHLHKQHVTVGQRVKAGDQIADMGATGNVTGPHLHLEIWANGHATSHRNPRIDFRAFKIKPGSKPKRPTKSPKPHRPPSQGKPSSKVKRWQKRQNKYGDAGLVTDGIDGPVSADWRSWVKRLQRTLPSWKGIGRLVIDGDYGPTTRAAVAALQSRNGLYPDGYANTRTIRYMRENGSNLPYRPSNRPS